MSQHPVWIYDSNINAWNTIQNFPIALPHYHRLNHFDAVMNICTKELRNAEDGETITRTESIYNTLAKISPDIDSVIPFAAFCGNFVHLKPILTDEGLCFAFNMLNSRDIYTDEYESHNMILLISLFNSTNFHSFGGYQLRISVVFFYSCISDDINLDYYLFCQRRIWFKCYFCSTDFRLELHPSYWQ